MPPSYLFFLPFRRLFFFFKQNPAVDLIFSDIELGDGLSFELFEQLDLKIPAVFCTAYREYTLDAFRHFGIEYIVKPFQKRHVEQALLKYQDLATNFRNRPIDFSVLSNQIRHDYNQGSVSILVFEGDKIIPLNTNDIHLFYIREGKVHAYTTSDNVYPVTETLDELEKKLPYFFRANRQFLLSRKAVKDASQHFNRKLMINLHVQFHEQIIVSRLKVQAFLEWLSSASVQ